MCFSVAGVFSLID